MHYKRKKAKSQTAGCKQCKHWKINGIPTEGEDGEKFSDHKRRIALRHELMTYMRGYSKHEQ